jgi:hypothetical protein
MPALPGLLLLALALAAAADDASLPADRVRAVLAGRADLPVADLPAVAPALLPPGLLTTRPATQAEVGRLAQVFGFQGQSSLNATTLAALATDRPLAFMALADVSKNGTGVVNREHEYPAWAARDDTWFDPRAYGDQPPPSIDRVFAAADWTADERRGINRSAAARLGLGEPAVELRLALDENGDGRLDERELAARAPADAPYDGSPPHFIYRYTPANGQALARAALAAFDADRDGSLAARELASYATALAWLRARNSTATPDSRRLVAALVGGDRLTTETVAAYSRRAAATGAFAIAPPGEDARVWFRKVSKGGEAGAADFVAG